MVVPQRVEEVPASVEKLEQKVVVILHEGGVGRWSYEINCVAHGNFRWLRGYSATRMRYKPSNFWYAPPIHTMNVEPARGGGYAVMTYFQPNVIRPEQPFQLNFAFDLYPTWNYRALRFTEKILNDAHVTQMKFLLPRGYVLAWANRPPDQILDAGSHLLVWNLTLPNSTYQFDFIIKPGTA